MTKAKSAVPTPGTSAGAPSGNDLAQAFAKAIKLLEGGKAADAVPAFEQVAAQAQAEGNWALKRSAATYLAVAKGRQGGAKTTVDPLVEAQALLNRHDADGALKVLTGAKSEARKAQVHYLTALAHAQKDEADAAAEHLKKAIELDPDLVHPWRLEPEVAQLRRNPAFAFTER